MKLKRIAVAGLAALLTCLPITVQAKGFKDVPPKAWYYDAVDYVSEEGIFAGTGEGKFSPDMAMTRGMFVTVLGRKAGVNGEKPHGTSFTDVTPSAYYAPFVEWAAGNGIVSGKGGGLFGPNDPLTREQMVTILYRYAQVAGLDLNTENRTLDAYPDKSQVAGYAQQAMAWAVARHIVGGADGKLLPKAEATRAQVAQVFLNARDLLTKAEPEGPSPDSAQDGPSPELRELRALVEVRLPAACQWDERALQAGWYGPMRIGNDGDLANIARGCVYMLTEIHGGVYDYFYIEERSPGTFYLYYG